MLAVPGHPPGSIALHLPEAGLLPTGDTQHRGGVVLGPSDTHRELAWRSLERLARWTSRSPAPATVSRSSARLAKRSATAAFG